VADLSIEDLFPPAGHRYMDAAKIEVLRQESLAVGVGGVIISAREAGEIVCDLSNGAAELDVALARVTLLEAALEDAIHDWLSCDDPTARARQIQRIYDNQVHGWTMHLSPMACAEALLTVRAWSDEDNNDSVSDAALDGGE
jgi:hypothetical protein